MTYKSSLAISANFPFSHLFQRLNVLTGSASCTAFTLSAGS
jgi:hypothetical protein